MFMPSLGSATSKWTDVTIDQAPITLAPSQSQQFTATVLGSPNTAVSWTSSPAGAGTISSTGLYTAPASVATQQIATISATSVADASKSSSVFVTLNPPPGAFVPIRMKGGGPAYTDPTGKLWNAEYGLTSGGGGTAISLSPISGTTIPAVYQGARWGDSTYTFPVPNGAYNVTFKLAELFVAGPGRTTNYAINGSNALASFDIFAAAGGQNIAIDRTFPVTVTNGQIVVSAGTVNYGPIFNAIEITQQQGPVSITMAPGSAVLVSGANPAIRSHGHRQPKYRRELVYQSGCWSDQRDRTLHRAGKHHQPADRHHHGDKSGRSDEIRLGHCHTSARGNGTNTFPDDFPGLRLLHDRTNHNDRDHNTKRPHPIYDGPDAANTLLWVVVHGALRADKNRDGIRGRLQRRQ